MMKHWFERTAVFTLLTACTLLHPSYASTPGFKTAPSEITISSTPIDNPKPAKVAKAAPAKAEQKPAPEENLTEAVPTGKKLVAHVVWVKGSVTASEAGGTAARALKKSSNVYMNDTVETGPDSEAQLVFTDDSVMTFRAATKMYINEYNYQPKGKDKAESKSAGKYVMDLVTGGLRTLTGFVAKQNPDNYQVNTPVATIGVRGTEFSIVYTDGKLYMKQYKGEPCLAKKGEKSKNTLCLDKDHKYGSVPGEGQTPMYLADQPAVFSVDVEVIPVTFSNGGVGFCGVGGCKSGGGGSGFCIQ